jgi:hypothetical protein
MNSLIQLILRLFPLIYKISLSSFSSNFFLSLSLFLSHFLSLARQEKKYTNFSSLQWYIYFKKNAHINNTNEENNTLLIFSFYFWCD